jgi:hypothetical protein
LRCRSDEIICRGWNRMRRAAVVGCTDSRSSALFA